MATVGAVCDMQTNKLCLTLIDPTVYYDPVRVVNQQTGYMEIGNDPWFIAVFYCDHEAKVESETKSSIATQPKASIDKISGAPIDRTLEASIDNDHVNEKYDFPEWYINGWENDYYQPSFAVHTAIPSKRKMSAMETDEYDEDYKEKATIEYRGLAMEESWVLKSLHETRGETSINRITKHRWTFITEHGQTQEQKLVQILVISEQMSLLFSENHKENHVPWMDEL